MYRQNCVACTYQGFSLCCLEAISYSGCDSRESKRNVTKNAKCTAFSQVPTSLQFDRKHVFFFPLNITSKVIILSWEQLKYFGSFPNFFLANSIINKQTNLFHEKRLDLYSTKSFTVVFLAFWQTEEEGTYRN